MVLLAMYGAVGDVDDVGCVDDVRCGRRCMAWLTMYGVVDDGSIYHSATGFQVGKVRWAMRGGGCDGFLGWNKRMPTGRRAYL
jgi:hypothetical protein